jgi:hypothetical protein
MGSRFIIMSRIAKKEVRQDLELGDFWRVEETTYDKVRAESTYAMYRCHGEYREYMLAKLDDPLNDDLVF